ncbi:type I protein arginine methyltransferase [Malassezia sp. CBS 17886]|nr:type I protein arginine methyltransferase [Malassezia sp. CBS 17886]
MESDAGGPVVLREGETAAQSRACPYDRADEAYFSYYSALTHQAQMLQDAVRTAAYQLAILQHAEPFFADKVVMDVGAGNGILSLFALQAGARVVYAVEASGVEACLRRLVASARQQGDGAANTWIRDRLAVVHSRVEDVTEDTLARCAPDAACAARRVDTIVSECLGVLLVHERMCESFIEARDRFLQPGGALFPSAGTLCFTLLNDARLWHEVNARGNWWNTANFYGIDLTPFVRTARAEAFGSPVVGCFSPTHVVGARSMGDVAGTLACPDDAVCRHVVDFRTVRAADLREFDVPLAWDAVTDAVVVHGLGAWFDLSFLQADEEEDVGAHGALMTTSPFAPPTHWAQVRLLFEEPLALNRGQRVEGTLHFSANASRSYDISAHLWVPWGKGEHEAAMFERRAHWKLDNQTYSWESVGG